MYTLDDLDYRFSEGITPKEAFKNMKSSDNPLLENRYFIINNKGPISSLELEDFLKTLRVPRVRNSTMYCVILENHKHLFFNCKELDFAQMDSDYIYRHALSIRDRSTVSSNAVKVLMQIANNLRRVGYGNSPRYIPPSRLEDRKVEDQAPDDNII